MTPKPDSDPERLAAGHRAAFALITAALWAGGAEQLEADVRATLRQFVDIPVDTTPAGLIDIITRLSDLVVILTAHTAGNLLRATGSLPVASATIRAAAVDQEIYLNDTRPEEPPLSDG